MHLNYSVKYYTSINQDLKSSKVTPGISLKVKYTNNFDIYIINTFIKYFLHCINWIVEVIKLSICM